MKAPKIQTANSKPLIKSTNAFPVVGIGASAGGLDAFRKLLSAIPLDSGMAYVLVQHLDPNHESILTDLLRKSTTLPVVEITDDIDVRPNHVYIIPSNKMLIANDGVLELSPRLHKSEKSRNLPIDLFFASLAEVHQDHAIGVVLSGTASDGTLGLKAIRNNGGLTFAQDNASAAYTGMPNSAAQAGVVDFILPPGEIPAKILEIHRSKAGANEPDVKTVYQPEEITRQILLKIRDRKGTDFVHYKQATIRRRILRRMTMAKKSSASEYLAFLNQNDTEIDLLYQDLLIPVTNFFRDPKSFQYVSEYCVPLLLKRNTTHRPIRLWTAGCSTGEEAYSLAMCFLEAVGTESTNIQLFATDLSEPAIAKARAGKYSKKEVAGVSAPRLKRFFTRTNDYYTISKRLRDVCVFARHDFLKDPPFIKMDFISCRNVLIYMEPALQKKALTTFHYALNEDCFLFVGRTESTNGTPEFFKQVKKNEKIFTSIGGPAKYQPGYRSDGKNGIPSPRPESKVKAVLSDFRRAADAVLLSRYTLSGVVVNDSLQIVHFIGDTSKYLTQSPGVPNHSLIKMARQGLNFELRTLFLKVKKEKALVLKENIRVEDQGVISEVSLEVTPLSNTTEPHYLVVFKNEHSGVKTAGTAAKNNSKAAANKMKFDDRDIRISQLEAELGQTRDDMRSITDDQEATNEELQSDNEELLSSSEELQSLNEELETSKEELQSSNEELLVVNQEMETLNRQLKDARNYAEAIVSTMRDSLLVLDQNLRIKTANETFYDTFRVTQLETEGTLIYDLGDKQWDIPSLRILLDNILRTGNIFFDFEVTHSFRTIGHRTVLLNAREMNGENSHERLILLAIEDVTEKVKARTQIEETRNKLAELQLAHSHELEENVLQRTAELTEANASLKQKNGELLNMNKELDSFTFISSHDMQEPLRKIQTYAGRIISTETLSESGADDFRKIQSAALRMRHLIDDLLAFSRLGTGEIKFENTDIGKIVGDVLHELKDTIAEKNAVIEIGELCDAYLVPFQFHQLLFNLFTNALKFSKPGIPPVISISSKNIIYSKKNENNLVVGKEYCHLTIRDNGIGFEPHFSKRIFEVFQRLHSKTTFPGTGIGLAIVKKVVDNHKGIIIATSELSKGATFDVYFPVNPAKPHESTHGMTVTKQKEQQHRNGSK